MLKVMHHLHGRTESIHLKDNIMNIVRYDEQMAPGSVASSYNLLCYVHYYFKNV